MIFRVAIPGSQTATAPCGYHGIHPRPDCPDPGLNIEWALFIMRLVAGSDVQFQMIPANGYSMKEPNDSSVIELIHYNYADISLPYMTITPERMENVSFLSPLTTGFSFLVYRSVTEVPRRKINLDVLYPDYILAWAAYLLLLYYGIKFFSRFGPFPKTWEKKVQSRTNYTVLFFYGVLTSFVRSNVTIRFNSEISKTELMEAKSPFYSSEALLQLLESGEYTAIVDSKIYLDQLLNPLRKTGSMNKRYVEAAKTNPPKMASSTAEMIRWTLNPPAGKKFVIVGGMNLKRWIRGQCDLSGSQNEDINFGYDTIMIRKELAPKYRLNSGMVSLAKIESQRLTAKYLGEDKCGVSLTVTAQDQSIQLDQVLGAFYTVPILLSVALLALLSESLYRRANQNSISVSSSFNPTLQKPKIS